MESGSGGKMKIVTRKRNISEHVTAGSSPTPAQASERSVASPDVREDAGVVAAGAPLGLAAPGAAAKRPLTPLRFATSQQRPLATVEVVAVDNSPRMRAESECQGPTLPSKQLPTAMSSPNIGRSGRSPQAPRQQPQQQQQQSLEVQWGAGGAVPKRSLSRGQRRQAAVQDAAAQMADLLSSIPEPSKMRSVRRSGVTSPLAMATPRISQQVKPFDYAMEALQQESIEVFIHQVSKDPKIVHDRNSQHSTLLHSACAHPQQHLDKIVASLLKHGADVNAPDHQNNTPLHVAASKLNLDACEMLLAMEVEMDVQALNSVGMNALCLLASARDVHKVAREGERYLAVLNKCSELGAGIECRTPDGDSALHLAVLHNNLPGIYFLLERGAFIDSTNLQLQTPLYLAVQKRYWHIAEVLLKHDADPTIETNKKSSAVSLCTDPHVKTLVDDVVKCYATGTSPAWVLHTKSSAKSAEEQKRSSVEQGTSAKFVQHFVEMLSVPVGSQLSTEARRKAAWRKLEDHLSGIMAIHYGAGVSAQNCSWAPVFNRHMLLTQTVLSKLQLSHLRILVDDYLKYNQSSFFAAKLALGLQRYLQMHQLDPENAVLGLQPQPSLLCQLNVPLVEIHNALMTLGADVYANADNYEPMEGSIHGYPTVLREQLVEMLGKWKRLSDVELAKKARAIAVLVDNEAKLKELWKEATVQPGDLVITLTEQEGTMEYTFLRYSGVKCGQYILKVYTEPSERSTSDVLRHLVLPLPPSMKNLLENRNTMSKLVQGPVEKLLKSIHSGIRKELEELFEERSVDADLIYKCTSLDTVSIEDGPAVAKSRDQLQAMLDSYPHGIDEFLAGVKAWVAAMTDEFLVDKERVKYRYIPSLEDSSNQLLSLNVEALVKDRINRLLTTSKAALSRMDEEKARVAGGKSKRQITEWWLSRIKIRVRAFLAKMRYDFNTVPTNYIEEAPSDLAAVKRNLQLIQEILDRTSDTHGVKKFVEDVKSEIYPKVNQFLANAKFTIADMLNLSEEACTLPYIKMVLESNSNLNATVHQCVSSLMSDIEYLEKIQFLEENPSECSIATQDLSIVPISGLVMSCFYRMENELKTVLEVWDRPDHAASSSMRNKDRTKTFAANPSNWIRSKPKKKLAKKPPP